MIFQQMKLGTSAMPLFHVMFDWAIHFQNYYDYSSLSLRSKGQFQGHLRENILFNK